MPRRFDPVLLAELRSALEGLRTRHDRLMPIYETLEGKGKISADARVLWGDATRAAKLAERHAKAAELAGLQAEIDKQDRLAALPRATDRAVRQAMRERIAGWPDSKPAPDEEADFLAISAKFAPGSLSRDDFRIVRRDETPPEWRTQGPRRPWGQIRRG
jgi:hypothetical protein